MTTYKPFLAVLTCLACLSAAPSRAALIPLVADDGFNASSFNSGLNWSDGNPPSAGNDYITNDFRVRTPPDGNSYVFGGDSLTVNNTNGYSWGLMYKGTGSSGVITVDNLILAGGQISHANGTGDLFQLDGAITVNSPSEIYSKQGNTHILADISGTGDLAILATDDNSNANARIVTLFGASTLSGDIDVSGKLTLAETGSLFFGIGSSGVNNSVSGSGVAVYNGTFNFDLSGASGGVGDSWAITSVATQSFGSTFDVAGFASDGAGLWASGGYRFDQGTGILSVVPEPTSLVVAVGAVAACCVGARRRD
jgi:hypothetical protein